MKSVYVLIVALMTVGSLSQAQITDSDSGLDAISRPPERHEPVRRGPVVVRPPEHRGPVVRAPEWHPYRGYRAGWDYRPYQVRPGWWQARWAIGFVWLATVYPGYWQCTAFNNQGMPYSAIGPNQPEAAYGAVSQCQASQWGQFGCFIPAGYCNVR